jgi:(p)ppGpp synthase/HD superfamily hydrolase
VKIDDYISTPKKSGYRAVHVMAVFHGHVVEIQLRTEVSTRGPRS